MLTTYITTFKKNVIELSTLFGSICVRAVFISLRTIDATKENVEYGTSLLYALDKDTLVKPFLLEIMRL